MKSKIFCFAFLSAFLIGMVSAPSAIAGGDASFKVTGYAQSWFIYDDSNVTNPAISNEFLVRRARIAVKGKSKIGVLPVKYKIMGDFAASKGGSGKAFLLDAYLDLNFDKLFNVGMGQFKYHFTEIGTASSKIKAIGLLTRPEIVHNLHTKLVTKGSALRDIGIRIHGKQKGDVTFGYDLEVLNGNGANNTEMNDDKTIVGHVFVSTMDVTFFGAVFSGNEGAEGSDLDETGWTVGAKYKAGPVWFQAEYAAATLDQGAGATDKEPQGWYIQGAYNITPELQGVVRYGQADADDNKSNNTMSTVGLGANYKVNKHATISANYYIRDADSGYSEKTLWGRAGAVTVKGSDVGNIFMIQGEYTY